jgi:hypothetical protein
MQIAVDVVFDHRHAAFGRQLGQSALVLVGHDAAERVAGVGHQQAGGHLAFAGGQVKRLDRQAGARIGGNFQRLQSENFEQLQHQVISR